MRTILLLSVSAAIAAAAACSASDGQSANQTGGFAGQASTTGGSSGTAGDASTAAAGGGGGIVLDATVPDAQSDVLTEDSACAGSVAEAKPVPVNLYIMLDRSGSMGGTKWSKTTAGLIGFIQSPASAGLRVALNYFPAITGNDCDPLSYSTPHVGLGTLTSDSAPADAQEQKLVDSLSTTATTGLTPMHPAFVGTLGFCTSLAKKTPNEKVIAVLVTDGSPTGCANSGGTVTSEIINKIAALAASGYADTPPIITFTIGLEGSKEAELKQIAQAGGGEAFFIGSTNLEQELTQKLLLISGGTIACEYLVPESTSGTPADPTKVNVSFFPGIGSPEDLLKVDDPAYCIPNGWYYDDPDNPTRIILCPETCSAAQGDPSAKIEILVGCETKVPEVPQ
jgi:Mg-chelatase subunit ChlD